MGGISAASLAFLLLGVCLAAACLAGDTVAAEPRQKPAATVVGWSATDVQGVEHRPLAPAGTRCLVLVFTLPDCPIANGYVPELNRLHEEFRDQGVPFFLVQTDPDLTVARARKHAEEYKLQFPALLDRDHRFVDQAGATHTPEAALYSVDGKLLYRGRIDNRYADFGKRRAVPTKQDLRTAVEETLSGKRVSTPRTEVVGCRIPPPAEKPSKPRPSKP